MNQLPVTYDLKLSHKTNYVMKNFEAKNMFDE